MKKIVFSIWVLVVCLFASCNNSVTTNGGFVPSAPDYSSGKMWYNVLGADESGVDVFYIPSTWEFDWVTADSQICHYADITNEKHLADMSIEMAKVAEYMADGNRFYSPFYRHITLNTWATLNDDTITSRYNNVSLKDVQTAFNYYLNNFNEHRPFILAGFSQGGKSVVELMKSMPENVRGKMVAAYVLGYKVTAEDVAAAPWIREAKDSWKFSNNTNE